MFFFKNTWNEAEEEDCCSWCMVETADWTALIPEETEEVEVFFSFSKNLK